MKQDFNRISSNEIENLSQIKLRYINIHHYLMTLLFFVTAKQLATILPFCSSQIFTDLSNLIPGKLPFALFKAIPREHLADIILSSCIRYTFTSVVEILGQYRSQVKAFLIFVHLECWQLKKPFSFILSFSLSMTMPSAL